MLAVEVIMKVLKEGIWNIPWTSSESCDTCKAELLIEEGDVKPTYNRGSSYYFICVVCGKSNTLRTERIALRVREAVDKKRGWSSSSDW